ncbi:hypothetical protein VNO77_17212 [Canavalia gladiata]|uniref:Uncharacterized protein n=1 Tax=Canavalia gladiata TaxID=3824 RepID=A0AAN9QJ64_CANGL
MNCWCEQTHWAPFPKNGHWTTLLSWQRIVRNETRQQRRRTQIFLFFFQKNKHKRNRAQYKKILRFQRRRRTTANNVGGQHPYRYQQDTLFCSISIVGDVACHKLKSSCS